MSSRTTVETMKLICLALKKVVRDVLDGSVQPKSLMIAQWCTCRESMSKMPGLKQVYMFATELFSETRLGQHST